MVGIMFQGPLKVGPYGFDATAEICTSVSLLCNVGNYNVYIHGVLSFRFCHWCQELPNPRAKAVFLGARDMNGGLYHNSFSLLYFISKFISGRGRKKKPTPQIGIFSSYPTAGASVGLDSTVAIRTASRSHDRGQNLDI
jgi:hypothetical protein